MGWWTRHGGTRWTRLGWRALAVAAVLSGCGAALEDEPAPGDERKGKQWREGNTYTISVSADATVDAREPDQNFGSTPRLTVDGTPERRAYLRFSVGELQGRVKRATLTLQTTDPSVVGPALHATSNDWSFSLITWSNAPPPYSPAIAVVDAVADDALVEYDVTSHVQGAGTFSFVLVSTKHDGVVFLSENASGNAQKPRLVIETEP